MSDMTATLRYRMFIRGNVYSSSGPRHDKGPRPRGRDPRRCGTRVFTAAPPPILSIGALLRRGPVTVRRVPHASAHTRCY